MRKARKKMEGSIMGSENSKQKRNLREFVAYWKEIFRKKEGTHVSRGMTQNEKIWLD